MLNGWAPALDLGSGVIWAAAARGLALVGLLLGCGTALLRAAVLRRAGWDPRPLMLAAAALALIGLVAWAAAEAALLVDPADGPDWTSVLASLPRITFGRVLLAQAACVLLGAAAGAGGRWRVATLAAAVAAGLQAGHLHAAAMEPGFSALLVCEVLHVLAAGAWLGALPALLLAIRAAPIADAGRLARAFSPLGAVAVLVLAGTALWQGWELVGGLPGLVGTGYGWLVLAKTALFAVLLGFAAANRFRLAPALEAGEAGARRALLRSIGLETAIGLLVVAVAAVLTSQQPGMHLQPVWPFAVRPSLLIVGADPVFREEVRNAVLALLGALGLVTLGVWVSWMRWLRWVAWAAAAAIAWRAAPHLDLLFVDAYPTSFYRSPTGFAATSIVAGQALYPQHCAACHGAEGRGDGPAAKRARIPPADLTAEHLWGHEDGELFWWLTDGIRSGEGERVMPGFGGVLSDEQRWALIDYVRARNAGLTEHATGTWTPPLRAPGFAAACAGGRSLDLAELRGRPVRIAFSAGSVAVDGCETDDPAVPAAYAVVTGQRPQALAGMVVLVDANGWLRGLFPAEDAARIAAAGQAIAANPLPEEAGAHRHRMAE